VKHVVKADVVFDMVDKLKSQFSQLCIDVMDRVKNDSSQLVTSVRDQLKVEITARSKESRSAGPRKRDSIK